MVGRRRCNKGRLASALDVLLSSANKMSAVVTRALWTQTYSFTLFSFLWCLDLRFGRWRFHDLIILLPSFPVLDLDTIYLLPFAFLALLHFANTLVTFLIHYSLLL